ncbi:unnamed protein product [Parajaminaea phylloscopi]
MDDFQSMSSGAPPAEEDFSKISIEDRLKHKAWKARVSAYEELSKKFAATPDDGDPIFRPYVRNPDALKSMITDANVIAQEKGVAAVADFVRYGGRAAGSTREVILPSVVEKCLGSTRAGTKKGGIEVVLLLAENEDILGSEGVVTDVLAGLSAKQPKLVAGAVTALTELVRGFGPKQVHPKTILKSLPQIFGHSDKNVRAEGVALAVELYRHLGVAIRPTVDSLKDIQAKELQARFEEIDREGGEKPSPTRFLLSQKAKAEAEAASLASAASAHRVTGNDAASAAEEAGGDADEFDAYELAEPVDPLAAKQWPADFDDKIKSAKWAERKEVLEAAKTVLMGAVKLRTSAAFDDFIEACAERIKKDATIHVWLSACQCLEAAAKGMREGFAKYKERTVPLLLEKLKEKKQSTVDVVAAALDAIFQTVTFGEILEYILAATKHKNPNVKTESIRFLVRCLRTTRSPPPKADIKPIADALLAACSDGSGDVRDAGTQGLGTLMRLIGERPMNPYLDQLDDIKKSKAREEFEKAVVKVTVGGAGATSGKAPVSARPPPATAAKAGVDANSRPKPVTMAKPASAVPKREPPISRTSAASPAPTASAASRGPPARLAAKATTNASSSASSAKAAIPAKASTVLKGTSKGAPGVSEPVKFRFTPDEAESRASEAVPPEIATQLSDSNWKERLAGIQALNGWVSKEADGLESELVVRALGRKPGWKESNFQVLAEVFKLFQVLAEDCPTFGRATIALSMQPLCEKLGDNKLKGPASETLSVYGEKTSFGFVLKQSLGPLASLKAPKAIADSLVWIEAALVEFGIQGVEVKSLVEHTLTCLKSPNAAVRNNATTVIGTLARFLGGALNAFLGELNPQLRTTIEGEISKAAQNPPPAPVRFSAELQQASEKASDGARNGSGAEDLAAAAAAEEEALDALIPRVDVDKLIPSSAIASMGDANWKTRKESLEEVQSVLQSHTRLKGTLNELAPALKLRYADSNIMCKTLALDIACKLAAGLGKGFEPQARTFVGPVTQCLADAKAPLRQTAAVALTAIADASGEASMIPSFAAVLETKAANPQLKGDLFAWLSSRFEGHPPDKTCDLSPLALHAVHCLDDKLAAVKKAALATLPFIIQRAGYKFVLSQADSMKPASKSGVLPLIEQARSVANTLRSAGGEGSTAPNTVKAAAQPRAAVAFASTTASPSSRSSPAPAQAIPASPKSSVNRTASGGLRPPSAATRSLVTASRGSTVATGTATASSKPGFGLRVGAARKAVMTSSLARSSSPVEQASEGKSGAPLLTSDSRHKVMREKKEIRGGAHWISAEGTPRPDLVDALRSQCEPHVASDVLDLMFSRDHNAERDFLSALALLIDFLKSATADAEEYGLSPAETVATIVANTDLLLKYVAIRLTDGNTSISLKCFDLLGLVVDILRNEHYHVSDFEANAILPCMVAKFGDAKVAFRDRIREIFRRITSIYPPSKLMTQLLEGGLPSKNARTRAECLGELGFLFSKNGLTVCTPSKTLPVVAKSISDRDPNVRTAALLALGECYKLVGDEIWSLIGRLPEKEMSLLEERLKRTPLAGNSKPSGLGAPAALSPVTRRAGADAISQASATKSRLLPPNRTQRMSTLATATASPPSSPPASSRLRTPVAARSRSTLSYTDGPVNGSSRPVAVPGTPQESAEPVEQEQEQVEYPPEETVGRRWPDVEQSINEVLSSELERSTQALKAIHQELQADPSVFAESADQLASVLAKQFNRAFGRGTTNDPVTARLRKYLIQVASSLFDSKMRSQDDRTLASFVEKSSLSALMTQLLQRLIDTSNQAKEDEDAKMYATYLNKVVIRCFGSCNLNVLYSTSFSMLSDATEDLRELSGQTLDTRFQFAELIVKCLWKVGRRLPTSLQEQLVEPDQLLTDVEAFLQRIGPNEWKARARDDVPLGDLPLRTVKVILSHLVSAYGENVLTHLDKIEKAESAETYKLLLRMISQANEAGDEQSKEGSSEASDDGKAASQRPGSIDAGTTEASHDSLAPRTASTDSEDLANGELKSIFERISQKQQSREAIKDLYEFQKRYPHKQPHIERSLQSTGPIFQRYIKRALANHAAEDDSARPPSIATAPATDTASSNGSGLPTGPTFASSPRSSHLSLGKGTPSMAVTPDRRIGSGHLRQSSNAEDRLAQLRAKFYKPTGSPRDSTASTTSGAGGSGANVDAADNISVD